MCIIIIIIIIDNMKLAGLPGSFTMLKCYILDTSMPSPRGTPEIVNPSITCPM